MVRDHLDAAEQCAKVRPTRPIGIDQSTCTRRLRLLLTTKSLVFKLPCLAERRNLQNKPASCIKMQISLIKRKNQTMVAWDDTDVALVNVLQLAPRAPWVEVAPIVGISASAAATRWRRLNEAGTAWTAAHIVSPACSSVMAFADIRIKNAHREVTLTALTLHPSVVGIDLVSDGRRAMLTLATPTMAVLRRILDVEIPAMPGTKVANEWIISEIIRHGADWRLGVLDGAQRRRAEALRPHVGPPRLIQGRAAVYEPIINALARDSRVTSAELARQLDRTPTTVQRQVAEVITSQALGFRCDAASPSLGWPINTAWFCRIQPGKFETAVALIKSFAAVRLAMIMVGEANFCVSVLHRNMDSVSEFPRRLAHVIPELDIKFSAVFSRSLKRSGWVLDAEGQRTDRYVQPSILSAERLCRG